MNVVKPNPFGQLSPERLAAFEEEIGSRLPEDYRKYLLGFNGAKWSNKIFCISDEEGCSSIHHVLGIHDGPSHSRLDVAFKQPNVRLERRYLPIADDDGGNKICIGIRSEDFGKIYFWDHETDNLIQIAGSFDEFVDSLSDVIVGTNEIEDILVNDDVTKMNEIVAAGYDIESLDEYGRSLIERAVVKAKPGLIEYLAREGVSFGNSLELAKKNAEYFEEHKSIVELITRLKNELH